MNFRDLTTGAYSKLHDLFPSSDAFDLVELLGYDYSSDANDFIYSQQEEDFTRELVNSFNQFAYWLARINLWEQVLAEYTELDAEELRFEFTTLQLDYCLHFPHQFKSKLVFCATQLCYTRGIAQNRVSRNEVITDEKINLGALARVAGRWKSGDALVAALREIDSAEYREQTENYRNKAQHRHGPRLDFGLVASIVREFPADAHVAYLFGQSSPLLTRNVLPVLAAEGERLRSAFHAYRTLVETHWHVAKES